MRRSSALAAVADIVGVLVFCAIGRRSHAEGLTLAGVAETAWPFLAGTAVGWLLSRGWRRPTAIVPTGVVVWVCTVTVGMLLRKTTSAGVAFSFVVVASTATAVLLLGWRLLAAGRRRRGLNPGQSDPAAAQRKSTE
jgi:peptidoglycan/LPS O-acetylase OafA/YrhL